MRRHAHDEAGKLARSVHDHLLAEEDTGVEPADLHDPQEPLLHLGNHEGDLIHVTRKHQGNARVPCVRPSGSPAQGNEVAHRVHPYLVRMLLETLPDERAHLGLVSRRTAGFCKLSHQAGGFHGRRIAGVRGLVKN